MAITFLGAGAWGTALAISAAQQGHDVLLCARDVQQAQTMRQARENTRYLPGALFPPSLQVVVARPHEIAQQAQSGDLVIVSTPMSGLRATLTALNGCAAPVAWLCKGFEAVAAAGLESQHAHLSEHALEHSSVTGKMAHEVCAQVAPDLVSGVLSGPSFAQEVARGQPTALVAASQHAHVREALVAAFHSPSLRVYANNDIVGVEVGGAVKNVLAIATGLCDGLSLGLNARAALITRGLAEMSRLGLALGARPDTFMGLSGLGDLVLTATGDLSRNRQVGLLLAQGQTLAQAVASLGHVAEGVYSARTVLQRARSLGVDMPITDSVVALLDGQLNPALAVQALMGRGPRGEAV
jgi:glycerol-3-phosphate dehydrogenase (NAD(P)+)